MIYTPSRPYKALASMRDSEGRIQFFQHDFSALPGLFSQGPMIRTQLYSSFLDIYFPASVDDPWYSVVTSWPTQPASTDLFQKSLTAWACISLGKTKGDKDVLQYGVRLYNQAIPLMSCMMRQDPYQDDILYSLMIWTELEVSLFLL